MDAGRKDEDNRVFRYRNGNLALYLKLLKITLLTLEGGLNAGGLLTALEPVVIQ